MTRSLAAAALALALFVGGAAHAQDVRVSPPAADAVVRYRVPVTPREPSRGRADALVTIVMFTDFQCPFCARAEATVQRLRALYGDDLRLVVRNNPLPFHRDASHAAQATLEARAQAGDAAYWRLYDRLFQAQTDLSLDALERDARELGLDGARLRGVVERDEHRAELDEDQAVGRTFGADGTPAFFIDGRLVLGAQPLEVFTAIVDDELARARALVAHGTPRTAVYAALTRDGLTHAEPRHDPPPTPRPVTNPDVVYAVPVGDAPVLGAPDALVTLVEFGDFQCPFCVRVQATLTELQRHYGHALRIVFRHNPLSFHVHARPAARLAVYAHGRGKFWPLAARLYADGADLSDDGLVASAVAVGLDASAARAALGDTRLDAVIDRDADLARRLGATGTPSFFVNGRNLRGAQPVEHFETLIDAELAAAQGRVAHGVPAARLYEDIVRGGAPAAELR